MKKYIIIPALFLLIGCAAHSQKGYWTPHWNDDESLFGYKTEHGEVKIDPKFTDFAYISRFDNFISKFEHIVAVGEDQNDERMHYYISKSGNSFGFDSIYYSISGRQDCENEGYIRFSSKDGLVGMVNKEGKVIIPAIYNELSKVHNGYVWALKDAEKIYDEDDSTLIHLINGKQFLLNTKGEVLIENFKHTHYHEPLYALDPYSMKTQAEKSSDSSKMSFLGTNGLHYVFSDYQLVFEEWINEKFLHHLTRDSFEEIVSDSVTYRGMYANKVRVDWTTKSKKRFIDENFDLISSRVLEISSPTVTWFTTKRELNPLIYDRIVYAHYFDNCGNPKNVQYPMMVLVVDLENGKQDQYSFLKTDNDYMLIGLTTNRVE